MNNCNGEPCNCKPMPYSPDWEKSFEEKFRVSCDWADFNKVLKSGDKPFRDELKDFIHSLLQAREEWLKKEWNVAQVMNGTLYVSTPEKIDNVVVASESQTVKFTLTPKN